MLYYLTSEVVYIGLFTVHSFIVLVYPFLKKELL